MVYYVKNMSKSTKGAKMKEIWKHFDISPDNITLSECGIQQFLPNQTYSYVVTEKFVLHYIEKGHGIIRINNRTYSSNGHNGYILKRSQVVTYSGNRTDPWKTWWIGLTGSDLEKFLNRTKLNDQDVLEFEEKSPAVLLIKEICKTTERTHEISNFWYKQKTYALLEALEKEFSNDKIIILNSNQDIVEQVYAHICKNYDSPLKINELANQFGISRSRLFTRFKERYGKTPKQFILIVKIDKAKQMLDETADSVSEIAQKIGFGDYFTFEKAFKKATGLSPTEWRKRNH